MQTQSEVSVTDSSLFLGGTENMAQEASLVPLYSTPLNKGLGQSGYYSKYSFLKLTNTLPKMKILKNNGALPRGNWLLQM